MILNDQCSPAEQKHHLLVWRPLQVLRERKKEKNKEGGFLNWFPLFCALFKNIFVIIYFQIVPSANVPFGISHLPLP